MHLLIKLYIFYLTNILEIAMLKKMDFYQICKKEYFIEFSSIFSTRNVHLPQDVTSSITYHRILFLLVAVLLYYCYIIM